MERLHELQEMLYDDNWRIESFIAEFNALPPKVQEALQSAYPAIDTFFTLVSGGAENSAEAVATLNGVLAQMDLDVLASGGGAVAKAGAAAFESITSDTSKDRSESISGIGNFITQVNKTIEAQRALDIAQKDGVKGTDEYNEALSTLADYLGLPVEALGDLSYAEKVVKRDTEDMSEVTKLLANSLADMAGIDLSAADWEEQLNLAAADDETGKFAESLMVLLGVCSFKVEGGMFENVEVSAENANTALTELRKTIAGYSNDAKRSRKFMTNEEVASDYTSNYQNMAEGIQYLQEVMKNAKEDNYFEILKEALNELDKEGILQPLAANFEVIQKLIDEDVESIDELRKILGDLQEQVDDMNLDSLVISNDKEREHNRASKNNYAEQVKALQEAFEDGGVEDMMDVWNGFDETIQTSMNETWPGLTKAMNNANKAFDAAKARASATGKALDKTSDEA